MTALAPVLTPHGVLSLRPSEESTALDLCAVRRWEMRLPGVPVMDSYSWAQTRSGRACLSYWRELGTRYVTALCALAGVGEGRTKPAVPVPAEDELNKLAATVPPMTGAKYLTASVLADLWRGMDAAFDVELTESGVAVQEFIKSHHPAWNLVGRVHFNLAETLARSRVERAIMIRLAGPIAQKRYRPTSWRRWQGGADYAVASELALRVCGSGEVASAFLKWLDLRAKALIEEHWSAVERLAIALIKHGTMNQEEIAAHM